VSKNRKKPVLATADGSHRLNGTGVAVITSLSMESTMRPITLRGQVADESDRLVFLWLTPDEARKVAADIVSLLDDAERLRNG
jgi:hypothetical protein